MSRPQEYRNIEIPETWDEWPENAKINYLCSAADRDRLLEFVGELADIPESEIGEQSIHKSGLAQLIIKLEENNE